jgi:hypothetical protein
MMKRYALLLSLVLCGIAPAFEGTVNVGTGAMDGNAASNSSTADRISKPGEYSGYSDAIYDDKYELTSQYVQVVMVQNSWNIRFGDKATRK